MNYLVLDVGDVPAEQNLISAAFQPAVQDVEIHLRPELSHVRWNDDRGTAEINRHHSGNSGDEFADGAAMRIVKAKTHSAEGKRLIRPLSIAWHDTGPHTGKWSL
ncbi:hypothetical protein GCM10010116_02320 [Microbispora rosea subsp. aerata]|nr:hypothetical protein GCM10010116_02320 [Microbispora rosea subsp. aerata]GIH56366.1 hypothetical protein Mro02_32800 [Microbispora rosea subsp. aerata]GLJ81596.1 hypothetical protein GCM10017588_03210 [Microbispora rosea subsp. aerata]